MEDKKLIFKIDGVEKDLSEIIEVDELQKCVFSIELDQDVPLSLFINQKEVEMDQILKKEAHAGYYYRSRLPYPFDEIGIYVLKLVTDGRQITQKIRARPIKISMEDYRVILEDIRKETYNLVFSVFGQSSEDIRLAHLSGQTSFIEYISFFRRNFSDFCEVFRRIEKDPNCDLIKRERIAEIYDTNIFDDIIEFEKTEDAISPIERKLGFYPKRVSLLESARSFNVYENRLLKHFLGLIINKTAFLESALIEEIKTTQDNSDFFAGSNERIKKLEELKKECGRYEKVAQNMWKRNFLDNVSKMNVVKTSMVLQKEPRYRSFYKLYQDFRKNSLVEINSDYFYIPIRRAWQVYEIWAFLKVAEVLVRKGFVPQQGLFNTSERMSHDVKNVNFNFNLKENIPLLELKGKNLAARVYYQRSYAVAFISGYGSTDPYEKKPDIAIEFFTNNNPIPEIVILDAKYKIVEERPPQSTLKDMSYYVETICDEDKNRIVKSAHAIYPGKYTESYGRCGYVGLIPKGDMSKFDKDIEKLISAYLQ
ncbi:MAG: DUF2357 domain-containing protein [Candidatus Bathyarchaeia archaeon]